MLVMVEFPMLALGCDHCHQLVTQTRPIGYQVGKIGKKCAEIAERNEAVPDATPLVLHRFLAAPTGAHLLQIKTHCFDSSLPMTVDGIVDTDVHNIVVRIEPEELQ